MIANSSLAQPWVGLVPDCCEVCHFTRPMVAATVDRSPLADFEGWIYTCLFVPYISRKPIYKPIKEVFNAPLIPQAPLCSAGFAVEITLTMRSAALSLFFASCSAIAGGCEDPNAAGFSEVTTDYVLRHKISDPVEAEVVVEDRLKIWRVTPNSACFFVETIHTNGHLCWLQGEAKRIGRNTYRYVDSSCKVKLTVSGKKSVLLVGDPADPKRQLCNPTDTENYACGGNTAVQSATFKRAK